MTPQIRLATAQDSIEIQAIYAPIVRDTAISFETEPPAVEEMKRRIGEHADELPWLVCEHGGKVAGFAYASGHRGRTAYQWSVEVSVYVDERWRGKGVARALYRSLFEILELQRFRNAYAGITLPNPASVQLHESLGFLPVGVYRGVGYKLGTWHDVGWWSRDLCQKTPSPEAPRRLSAVRGGEGWDAALETGLESLPF